MKDYQGRSFVVIIIVIAVSALVLRIAIEQIIKINIEHNESNAAATLKLIAAALENYAKDNRNTYPASISTLTQVKPRYLDKDYTAQSRLKDYLSGYNYDCLKIEADGYSCSAFPVKCGLTGRKAYSIITGGLFISEDCAKKE